MAQVFRYLHTRGRAIVFLGLGGITALSWAYLVWMARAMYGPDASCPMHAGAEWTIDYAAMTFLMWSIMMVAMMLPSVTPMILAVETVARNRGRSALLPWIFLAGYVLIWTGFSAGATSIQWALQRLGALAPAGLTVTPLLGGILLVSAGVYQLMPYKRACLVQCSPMTFLFREWRDGRRGAFIMGVRHGVFCVGCCAVIMLLLFVAGVMNLLWIALLAAAVLLEKALGHRPRANAAIALLLVASGVALSAEGLWRG